MLTEDEVKDDESLEVELDENQVIDEQDVVETQADTSEVDTDSEDTEEDEEDLIVTIGDEEPEPEKEPAPSWVKDLRKQNRELKKKLRLQEQTIEKKPVVELGAKPTLESCGWDEDKKDQELEAWFERKRLVSQQDVEKKQAEETQAKEWKQKQENYTALKDELKVKNFDDAEDVVKEKLNVNKQGIILHAAKNPALIVYALSKNKKKLEELSKIEDNLVFAYKLAELEGQLKVSGRKAIPKPETTLRGSGGGVVSDAALDRLYEKCSKKGDMTDYRIARNAKRKK
jgi:hypothetical protein